LQVYCSLKHRANYKKAIIASVNHSGDSDSTGAITGNIVGAYLGLSSIPEEWVGKSEIRDIIEQIADELLNYYQEYRGQ
jgi:ADP-ribosylglycohydrolase